MRDEISKDLLSSEIFAKIAVGEDVKEEIIW